MALFGLLKQKTVRAMPPGQKAVEEAENRMRDILQESERGNPNIAQMNDMQTALNLLAEESTGLFQNMQNLNSQMEAVSSFLAGLSECSRLTLWRGLLKKDNAKCIIRTATVANGIATFYLTHNGTANGDPSFSNLYKEASNFWVEDALLPHSIGNWSLSTDKRVLTVNVNKSVSLTLLTIQVLGAMVPANGAVVNATFWGD